MFRYASRYGRSTLTKPSRRRSSLIWRLVLTLNFFMSLAGGKSLIIATKKQTKNSSEIFIHFQTKVCVTSSENCFLKRCVDVRTFNWNMANDAVFTGGGLANTAMFECVWRNKAMFDSELLIKIERPSISRYVAIFLFVCTSSMQFHEKTVAKDTLSDRFLFFCSEGLFMELHGRCAHK